MWDSSIFVRQEVWGEKGILGVSGLWEGCPINIINVYSSCKAGEKRELWRSVTEKMAGREEELWCICGDFNAIRSENERRGVASGSRRKEMKDFSEWINNLHLIDLPLERRKYTWYKENGSSCSRIDRFLISKAWLAKWPNASQVGLKRKVSDYAAIILKE